jgi:hypothetical protein
LKTNWKLKRQIREKYGSQMRFARAVGMSESEISKIISGYRELKPEEQKRWQQLLNPSQE